MKRSLYAALGAFALAGICTGSLTSAQTDQKSNDKPTSPPVIIHATAHTAHFNDFQIRRSKDRSLETQIQEKGMDVAFTEWMQRDHPYIFAKECVKEVGAMASEFKTTNHMLDFDTLLQKRTDLRLQAEKYGHDVAFAEWLRTERPEVYRAHFGLDANNKPIKKNGMTSKKPDDMKSDKATP
jgi:hypothetical protein